MLVLITKAPRTPRRLTSPNGWTRNFASKVPNDTARGQATRTLLAAIGAVIIDPPPFPTMRPQFVQLPKHDDAMTEPAAEDDYV
jgi:hypothetical protein